jgi:hypothetical protein
MNNTNNQYLKKSPGRTAGGGGPSQASQGLSNLNSQPSLKNT